MAAGVWLSEKYVVLAPIASGGMADVHLARAEGAAGFVRTVAVKRTKPMTDREGLARAADEARILARISHPHVVSVLDVVEGDDEIFIVMDYVHGASLATVLGAARKHGEIVPPAIVSAILVGVLRGLDAAHGATSEQGRPLGIIHRDISPPNVLIGADGVARLVDFGVARAHERAVVTETGVMHGKLGYLAPEQLAGEEATRRSDIYACGILLWESLACEPLFRATNLADAVTLRAASTIPSAMAARGQQEEAEDDRAAARALEEIAKRALATKPADRFATASEMATTIERDVRPATAAEVGEWIERVASSELARRQSLLAEVESAILPPRVATPPRAPAPAPAPAPALALAPGPAPPHAPRRRLLFLSAIAGATAITIVALRASSDDPAPPRPPTPIASATTPVSSAEPPLSSSPPPPVASLPVPSAASPSSAPTPAPATRAVPTTPAIDCSIPYDLVDGIRRYRRECVGAEPRDGYPASP